MNEKMKKEDCGRPARAYSITMGKKTKRKDRKQCTVGEGREGAKEK